MARTPVAVMNERSLPPNSAHVEDARIIDVLSEFVRLLRKVRSIRSGIALASMTPFGDSPLTVSGQTLSGLAQIHGGRILDQWRYVQALRNVSPFGSDSSLGEIAGDAEFLIDGEDSVGLGVALVSRQLAVSLLTDSRWDVTELELNHRKLIEHADTGAIGFEDNAVKVVHASRETHAETHREYIRILSLPRPYSGSDLWLERDELYPRLQFLSRVEEQLLTLGPGASSLSQIHDRLCELNDAIAEWDPTDGGTPKWRSLVTPESSSRRGLCNFTDMDGTVRCFEHHARFTPGAGRIHFLIVHGAEPCLRIAHIGMKLDR